MKSIDFNSQPSPESFKDKKASLWSLFFVFFRIGAFTFGGGWAMIALIQNELVERKKWLSKEEFLDTLAISQSLPGILAVNISIFTGNKLRGKLGVLFATMGTVLPSFVIMLTIVIFFSQFTNQPSVVAVFKAVRPAVVALILIPVFTSAKSAKINRRNIWLPISVVIAVSVLKVSPVYVIIAVILGAIIKAYLNKQKLRK